MEQQSSPAVSATKPMKISDTFALKQGFMGFAALWIYIYHVWLPVFGGVPVLGRLEAIIKYVGFSGVDLFFFLSGGGLVFSIQKGSVLRFYQRRLERIVIPYLLIGICYALLNSWSVLLFLSRISGVYFYTKSMYGFLWYVPAILTFYLLFPAYYYFFSRAKNRTLFTVIVLSVWLALSILLKNTLREDLYGFTNRIPIFLIGVYCGQRMQDKNDTLPRWFPLLSAALLLGGIALSYLTNVLKVEILFPVSNACFPNILMTLGIMFLVPWVIRRVIRREISPLKRFFNFFGTISLTFYCTQELLLRLYERFFGFHNPIVDNLILFAVITLLSYLLYRLVELILRLLKGKPAQPTIS